MKSLPKAAWIFRFRARFLCIALLLTLDLRAAEPTASPTAPLIAPFPRVPPTEPADAAKTFQVLHGFRMELLAAEPLVTDPVAMAYDEDGRAYVCEMNDYPYTDKAHHKPNQENPTDKPIGRIRLLVDTDGDGRFDKSTVFADGLSWPTGIACWKGGIFVAATPDVWYFKDTDGDGVADVREKVFTGFKKLNVQAVMNNFIWGLDNRIYAAGSSNGGEIRPANQPDGKPLLLSRNDLRFDPNEPAKTLQLISGGARFGNSFDDWGNRFLCNIRNPAQHVVLPSRYLARNPFLPVRSPINDIGPSGEVPIYRVSPVEPWRELRAKRWAGERDNPAPSSELVPGGMVTSSSGITVYRGAAYPKEFRGNVFTAEPGNNVFYRQTLIPDGPTFKAERIDAPHEMVASTDIWFRAVNFVNAPDGTLHVCDMYRENIEHPWSIPDDIHAAVDLESGRDRGRIWRLAPPGFTAPKPPRLSQATAAELVATLENPNAWWRETAQRLLFERQDASAVEPLRALLQKSPEPLARLHVLWTLDGLHKLNDEDIARGLADKVGGVREHAVKLAESHLDSSPMLLERVLALADDPDVRVCFQVAFTLGETKDPRAGSALALIAKRGAADPWMRAAVLSSAAESCDQLLAGILSDTAFASGSGGQEIVSQLAFVVAARNRPAELARVLAALPPRAELSLVSQVAAGLGDGLKRSGRSLRKAAAESAPIIALLDEARRRAVDATADVSKRERAIRLLGYDEFNLVKPTLTALLDARQPAEVQRAAVQALAGLNHPDIAKILIDPWRNYTPSLRAEVVQGMLGVKNRIVPLFDAIEDGRIAANQIPPARRGLLLRNKDPEIQARAAKLFGNTAISPRKDVIEKYKVALTLKGDARRGQGVFETNCMICHRVGDKGNDVGPDLSTIRQWSAEQMLVNILDPNREVAPNFIQYVVELKDGQTVVGLIADETPTSINLRGAGNPQQTVLRQNIASMTSLGVSLMPDGVEANINPQQMADLLAFLREPSPATAPPEPGARPLEGFRPLFNGKNFSGWKINDALRAVWRVEGAHFHAKGGVKGGGFDLWSEKSYRDFVLRVDWRLPAAQVLKALPTFTPDGLYVRDAKGQIVRKEIPDAGDSGVFLRGDGKYQVNLWSQPMGSGDINELHKDDSLPAELRRKMLPMVKADAPFGQWNRFLITLKADRVTVVLNDRTVIDDVPMPGIAPEGPIALQYHGDAIDFANIFIRELNAPAGAGASTAPAAVESPGTMPLVSEEKCPAAVLAITTKDGNQVPAVLRKPPGRGPFPALIHLHGGLGTQSLATLKMLSLRNQTLCRFLAAGYVTVNPTFRSREKDPQTRDALVDCLAVIEHVKKMPEVDPKSVVVWGDSGGGSLALELAGETDLCAAVGQEPATVLFSGMFSTANLGEPGSPDYRKKWRQILLRPQDYYTPDLQKFTREKIAKIHCPILIAHGDRHPINRINNEIIIPELKAAGRQLETILYAGEQHGFSLNGTPSMTKKFFEDCDAFFKNYVSTKPVPLDEKLLKWADVESQAGKSE